MIDVGAQILERDNEEVAQEWMRMRKLGKGQSFVFCVPEQIRLKIIEFTRKNENTVLEVADVISWAISETFL